MLKKLYEAVVEAEKLEKMDLEGWPQATRPGMELRRNRAIAELDTLRTDYAKAVRAEASIQYITRDAPTFHKDETEILLDAKAFYKAISEDAIKSMKGAGRFTPTEISLVMHAIRTIGYDEMHLVDFQRPDFGPMLLKSIPEDQFVNELQKAVVKANGHRLGNVYLGVLLAKEARKVGCTESINAAIIGDPEEIQAIISSGVFSGPHEVISSNTKTETPVSNQDQKQKNDRKTVKGK